MRWFAKPDDGWRVGFALWPLKIGDDVVWLERYRYQFRGEYTAVKLYSEGHTRPLGETEAQLFDLAWDLVTAIRGGGPLPHKTPAEVADLAHPTLMAHLDARNAKTRLQRG